MKWPPPSEERKRFKGSGFNPLKSLPFPFIIFCSFAIICSSLVTYSAHRLNLQESLFSQAENHAKDKRDILQTHLAEQLARLLALTKDLTAQENIAQKTRQLLADPAKTSASISDALKTQLKPVGNEFGVTNISLLDSSGLLIFNHGHTTDTLPINSRISIATRKTEFSDLIQIENVWMLSAAFAIENNRIPQGSLLLTLELNQILNEFANKNRSKLILASANEVLAGEEDSTRILLPDLAQSAQALAKKSILTIPDLPKEQLTHYMPIQIGSKSCILISETDLGPILQMLQDKNQKIIKSILLLLAIFLPLCAWFAHILMRPLIGLRKRAAGVAEELTGAPLAEYQGNEINRLIFTFDSMASALKEHEKTRLKSASLLQQEHASVEANVKERALELERTNVLLLREITERTQAQQNAEELQKFLAHLIDAIPSLLIGIDHNGRITQWNQEAQRFCNLRLTDVSGTPYHEALPWLNCIKEQIDQTLHKGMPNKISHLNWTTTQGDKLVDIVITPLSFKQNGGAVIRIDDVTERIRLDELIMQTEKMMSVGGLAAGMAHEINNPLASIIQNAQVITQRLSPDMNKNRDCADKLGVSLEVLNGYLNERQIPKMLSSILDSGQKAAKIVDNMLSFSRGSESVLSAQHIAELMDRAIGYACNNYELKKQHNISKIKFKRNYADNLPLTLCIPDQLEQVFFNLIQNSAQAMSTWREIPNAPQIDLTIQHANQLLSVDICDNGPGIDIEHQKRIFEPFYTTKDVGLGTGLGLSVSYFIITKNHKGQLSVDSRINKGTCFHILLPLQSLPEE